MAADQPDDAEVRHTTEPALARTIIEERGGYPAHVAGSEGEGDSGLLRVGFPDRTDADEDLKEISWEQFQTEFAEKDLAARYRDDENPVDGNRPVVLVEREHVEAD